MSLIDLYVRDKHTGKIHKVGADQHDGLWVDHAGTVHYQNLQNGDVCNANSHINDSAGYEFMPSDFGEMEIQLCKESAKTITRSFGCQKKNLKKIMKLLNKDKIIEIIVDLVSNSYYNREELEDEFMRRYGDQVYFSPEFTFQDVIDVELIFRKFYIKDNEVKLYE